MNPETLVTRLVGSVRLNCQILTLVSFLAGAIAQPLWAQAPPLAWTANVGARLFAVDSQTNVYANAGGTVVELTSTGVPVQTNAMCPLPGVAQRDSSGNFYFAGSFDGTQDFGGITLVGGWINNVNCSPPCWVRGYPTCFLAKYSSGGSLQWAVSFGQQAVSNHWTDVLLDSATGCYVGYLRGCCGGEGTTLAHFSASGSVDWQNNSPFISSVVTLGGLTASNCCFFTFNQNGPPGVGGGRIDLSGNRSGAWPGQYVTWRSLDSLNGKPVIDDLARALQVEFCNGPSSCTNTQVLRKFALDGSVLWSVELGAEEKWTLARDAQANVYLGGTNGFFGKYNTDGTLIWSTNYNQKCFVMIVDAAGNRFLSFADGEVARLGTDPPPQLGISSGPQGKTVFVGDSVTLTVAVTGTPPFRYFWRQDGTNVPNGTNASLTFGSATASQSGSYSVVVTNLAGSITSAPALLRVRSVAVYHGSELLTNGTYVFLTPTTFTIRSVFNNGSSLYTLDGSAPDFNSAYYSGPLTLSQSATIRAIGYSADFDQSQEADTVNAVVIINHTLNASSSGGGSVVLNPPGGTYPNTNIVAATATPNPGWSFLYWLGDASGTNASVNISMERDKVIYAVFGATLSTIVAGNGQVLLNPPGGLYAYSTVVRLTGLPQTGSYFGFWGNAATGNTNPLYFTITSPTQTVSSIFGTLSSTQAALTVLITGSGRVNANPRANAYPTNQPVTLTAVPDAGQIFINWSGDASGTQNPLGVPTAQSKVITANFSSLPSLRVDRPGSGLTPDGFRAVLVGEPGAFEIFCSTNLSNWGPVATVTNSFGEAQFTDPGAVSNQFRVYRAGPMPAP
jgi:hypothetical protein